MSILDFVSDRRARELNPLVLAYVGDSFFTLYVRQNLAAHSDAKVNALNKRANLSVRATAQAVFFDQIVHLLDEAEIGVARRARNTHTRNIAKSASLEQYKKATAFEAVVGYLALTNNMQRLEFLLSNIKPLEE